MVAVLALVVLGVWAVTRRRQRVVLQHSLEQVVVPQDVGLLQRMPTPDRPCLVPPAEVDFTPPGSPTDDQPL